MKDYYKTLGVDKSATADQIKTAYRKLAMKHHPDRGGDQNQFQEIQEAYAVLSDEQKRRNYDNPQPDFGQFGFGSHPGSQGFNFDTIFDIFGARFGQQHQQRQHNMRMSLWVQLTDVAQGGKRTVSLGTQHGVHAVEIDIPVGIEDGTSVQYGNIAPGGGDLIIQFRIHPHPEFHRNGQDLICEKTVSIWDLIVGGEVRVRDIHNNWFNLNIPERTQPGTILRMRGKGLPTRGGSPGDLLVRVQARIPDDISPDLIEQIRQNQH